ncbi:MAG: PKD domain-containing protein, partial [Bryobacteraceae bacterium]
MRYVCPAALAALSILTPAAMFGQLTISNYQLVSQQVVSLTTANYTYTAQVNNTGVPVASVTATVASLNPYAVRIQPNAGTLTFGPVATNGHATSTNTFTILVNRTASPAFNWADLQWSFQSTADAPVANAGPNQPATLHQLITLDGSGSTNPSGVGTLTYAWAFVSRPAGSSTVLANQTGVHPTFTVDVLGTYVIQLTVNNGTASSTASVTVTTADTMPVANAGPNQTVAQGATVTLNGASSSDSNGNPMTFLWTLTSVPTNSTAALTAPTAVFPTFVADKAGSYTAQLVVNDGVLNSNAATVTISTLNSPPVANPGSNQVVNIGATVQLDGSGSTDIDGDPLTYLWSLITVPTNSKATLSSTTAVKPTFVADLPGTYIAQLIVHDGSIPSTAVTVTITTTAPLAPTANAGPNQTVVQETTVQLSGGGTDPQGYQLTYQWSFTSRPLNSTATLTGATTATPTFFADQPGTFTVQLVVNDGFLSSNPALTGSTVTITTSDLAPTANAGPPQSVTVGSIVTLNGSGSVDLNGDALTYSWTFNSKPNGSTATLTGPITVSPTFIPDVAGVYVAQLIVTDSYGTISNPGSTVTITATQTPASITASSGTPQTANTFTAFALPLVATVKDANNHPIQGVEVTFTAPGSGASGTFSNSSTTIQVATDVNGNATATFTANGTASATAYTVTANVSPALGTAASFTLTNTQAPAASISVTNGSPQSAQILAAFGAPLVATVLDATSHPVPNVTVTFLAPGTGASGTFAGGANTAITNASGVATSVVFTANNTVGGPYLVNATVSGVSTPASFSLTNTAQVPASITMTSGSPQSANLNIAFSAPLVATVLDAANHPIPNVVVIFTPPVSGPSGSFAGGANTATTNASGVATSAVFTANGTVGGPYNVTANVSPALATPAIFSLTNNQAVAASITATSGTPQSVTNGTPFAPFVVLVKDVGGNPVSGATVTFTAPASGPSGTFAGNLNTAITNASGIATSAIFTANTTAGPQYTVAATVSGVATPASFLLTNTVGAAASVTATSGTPQSIAVGTAFAPLVVTVKDSNGNPVGAGTVVTFTAPASGPSGTFAGSVNTATTNASGIATSAIFTANTTAGPQYTVAATVSGVSNPANFLLTNTAGPAASITATSGTPQSVTEGTAFAPLVATVKDSGGNPVSGVTVTFTAPGSGPSGTFAGAANTATTNSSGVATSAIFTANITAGAQYTVAATVSGVSTPANFLLTNTAGAAASITATSGTPQSVANGTAFAPFVVTVKDSGGNPVGAGTVVTFTAPTTGPSGTFAGGVNTATTNASGVATSAVFTANTTVGAQYTVSASATGVTTPASFLLTNTAGSPASIAVTGGSPQSVAEGTPFASLVATVKDSNGNVVGAGVSVTFTAPALTGASGTFANSTITTTVTTNASGVATATTFTANGILGGPYNVAATVSGAATPANFVLTNTAGPAASITATSGSGQTATISNAFAAPLVATVKDSGGNPISNATVTFTAPALTGASGTFANGTITTTATTSAAGVATSSTFTANATGGAYSVNATVPGVATPAAYSLTNSVGLILQAGVQVGVGGTQTLNVSLSTAPSSSVIITLTTGSPGIVTLGPSQATSINISISAGNTTPASQPKVNGVAFGSAVITASATGYSNVTTTVVSTDTISFSPSTVTINGDTTSQAASYILLSSTAPTGGVTLNLSSSNTAVATVPATVTIGAGNSNINVPVTGVSGGTATITASNTSLNIAAVTLGVTVSAAQITTTQLNTGLLGAPYSQQLTASGGSGTYTWSVTSGTLPTGMTLSTGGLLGGTPSATTPQNGTPITFKITDTSSPVQTATATLTLLVVVGTPASITATAGVTQSTTDTTAFGSQFAVTVKDVNSFLVPNATVTFTAPSNGASGTFAGGGITATATTNSSGVATSPVFTANSTLGSYTVNATVSPVATAAAFNLTNAIGPASTIAVTGVSTESATEGTNFANPLVVTVKDVGANVISGATVTYTIVPNGSATGTFVGGVNAATTNAQGVATSAQFTAGGTAGTYTVTAASGSATGATFSLTNGVGGAASITVTSGNNQSAAAGSPTGAAFPNLVATVKDSGGNPVPNVTVTFAGPAQTLPSVTFATNPVTTDSNGNATVTATANTHAGPSYTVTATATGVATPASFTLTNTSGPAASIAVSSGSPQSVADGTAFVPLVAIVKDSGGNPVNNATVTFTIGTTSGATASFSGANTAATNASGLATSAGTLTANNVDGGPYTVTAAVSGVSTPASFLLTNVVGNATTITVNGGSPQSAPISSAFGTPLVAKVVDQGGNVVSGVVVTFQAPATGASGTFANGTTTTTATTASTGLATASTFTANATDNNPSTTPYIVTATATGVATPASFSLTNLVGNAASMTVNGGSGQGAAVGVQFTNPLSVLVKDSGGNPVSGVTVTFTSPASPNAGATFVSGSNVATATTGANGIATTSVAPTANSVEGGYNVTATANPSLSATFALTNNSGPPASITPVTATNNQTTTVGTAYSQPLQVTVKDANNNPANGITVTFTAVANGAVSGTFGGNASTTALTNASGLASATLTANTKAGGFTVTASVASPSLSTTFTMTSTPLAASVITATPSSTGQNVAINTNFANPLIATVTDSNGNPISGVTVTFAAPAGSVPSATFTPSATVTTGAAGTATVTAHANGFASGTAYTVTATATGIATPASFSLTNNAGPAANIAITGGNNQSVGIGTAYAALSVTVTDAGNNPVSGATVTFTPATVGGATATFAGGVNTATTNASGVATTTAVLTANSTKGTFTVAVTSGSATLATPFQETNVSGPAASIALSAPTSQSIAINTAFASPMVATVTDSGGNPVVSGTTVTFTSSTVSGATGTFSSGATATATTNASGVATAPTFTANSTAGGPYLVTVAAGSAPTKTFSMTNTAGAPASITITSGSPQSAVVGAPYTTPMVVTVKDAGNNVVPSATLTFTAPTAGPGVATGLFGSTNTTTATTSAQGVATIAANALTAGTVAGTFNVAVTASTGNATAVNFVLTNQAGAAASIAATSGGGQSSPISGAFTN